MIWSGKFAASEKKEIEDFLKHYNDDDYPDVEKSSEIDGIKHSKLV